MKKRSIGQLILLLTFTLLAILAVGGDVISEYAAGLRGQVRSEIRNATSVEMDLARLDQLVHDYTPQLNENRKVAAELDVELEFLEKDTQSNREQQKLKFAEMKKLRETLADEASADEDEVAVFEGRTFTRSEIEEDLSRRMRAYEQVDKQIKVRERIIAKRKRMLAVAVSAIKDCEQQQFALADTADALNAELKLLEVGATTRDFDFKKSNLEHAQQLAAKVKKRILSLERLAEQQGKEEQVPVNLDHRSVVERFDVKFNN